MHFRPLNGVNPPIKQRQGAARITNSTSHGSRHYVMIPTIPISSGGLDRPEFRLQGGKWFCLAFPRPAFRSRKDHNRCLFFSVHLEHCQGALFFFFFGPSAAQRHGNDEYKPICSCCNPTHPRIGPSDPSAALSGFSRIIVYRKVRLSSHQEQPDMASPCSRKTVEQITITIVRLGFGLQKQATSAATKKRKYQVLVSSNLRPSGKLRTG